jgi:hypothetical protein
VPCALTRTVASRRPRARSTRRTFGSRRWRHAPDHAVDRQRRLQCPPGGDRVRGHAPRPGADRTPALAARRLRCQPGPRMVCHQKRRVRHRHDLVAVRALRIHRTARHPLEIRERSQAMRTGAEPRVRHRLCLLRQPGRHNQQRAAPDVERPGAVSGMLLATALPRRMSWFTTPSHPRGSGREYRADGSKILTGPPGSRVSFRGPCLG